MTPAHNKGFFGRFAQNISDWAGHPASFFVALLVVLTWGISGPVFGYSDTWQLAINTGTTIVTFLMVFLIQNTQNKDTMALQLKLDELIRATEGAHTVLLDLEKLSSHELAEIRTKYERIAQEARKRLRDGKSDTNIPEILLEQKLNFKKKRK